MEDKSDLNYIMSRIAVAADPEEHALASIDRLNDLSPDGYMDTMDRLAIVQPELFVQNLDRILDRFEQDIVTYSVGPQRKPFYALEIVMCYEGVCGRLLTLIY